MTSDLYKKSPEAEALLKGIPKSLFRYAALSFIGVLLLVGGIATGISFPEQQVVETFVRIEAAGEGLIRVEAGRELPGLRADAPGRVTMNVRQAGGQSVVLEGEVREIGANDMLVDLTNAPDGWSAGAHESFATIRLSSGEIQLWEKLLEIVP